MLQKMFIRPSFSLVHQKMINIYQMNLDQSNSQSIFKLTAFTIFPSFQDFIADEAQMFY
jgi:hypothetical protein